MIQPTYPDGAQFAFTILDDTDDARVETVAPIYELLKTLGFRTTKTVWPVGCPEGSRLYFAGQTLDDPEYLAFVRALASAGFEIAFHCATMESSRRERTLRALDRFKEEFGHDPAIHCNHGQNRENVYWAHERYRSPVIRLLAQLGNRIRGHVPSEGHVPGSPYFWGDLLRERIKYVRNFAFRQLDTSTIHPRGPYHDPRAPFVNLWFHSADAPDAGSFVRLVTEETVTRMEARGGYCILSTHLGKGFVKDGRVDPVVRDRLEFLATRPGWFVPTGKLLDFLHETPAKENHGSGMARVELRHFADRLLLLAGGIGPDRRRP